MFCYPEKRRKIKRLTITEVSNPYEIVLTLSLKLGIITIMWWKQIERWTNSALASCTAGGCSLVQCLFHVTMIYCQCKQAQSAQQHSQPTSKISEQSVIFSYSTLLYNFLQARRNSQFQLSDTKRRATVTGVQWSSWASPTLTTGRFPPFQGVKQAKYWNKRREAVLQCPQDPPSARFTAQASETAPDHQIPVVADTTKHGFLLEVSVLQGAVQSVPKGVSS